MNRVLPVVRILLGLVFVVFSANYFVTFLPEPKAPTGDLAVVAGALVTAKFMAVVKALELAAGLALLVNRAVPLALAILAPIIIAITVFHAVLAPSGIVLPVVLIAFELVLAWGYRSAFAPMLRLQVTPDGLRK